MHRPTLRHRRCDQRALDTCNCRDNQCQCPAETRAQLYAAYSIRSYCRYGTFGHPWRPSHLSELRPSAASSRSCSATWWARRRCRPTPTARTCAAIASRHQSRSWSSFLATATKSVPLIAMARLPKSNAGPDASVVDYVPTGLGLKCNLSSKRLPGRFPLDRKLSTDAET
jgi:hypothetical protein